MTRRILAAFLGLLVFLLVAIVVPLGVKISSQQRHDFQQSAKVTARAIASAEEERLGDSGDPADRSRPTRPPVDAGDGIVVLGPAGRTVTTAGRVVPRNVINAVRSGKAAVVHDSVLAVATVGAASRPDGFVVLVRSAEPLDHRVHALWLALVLAAAVTLALGAVTAAGVARWIGRPLHALGNSAAKMGKGDITARSDDQSGPPEVRAVAVAFNDMAERVGALLTTQRTMTADVSHQLRTPLAALQLRLDLLAEDAPDEIRTELAGALREIGRLNRLLDGLLAVARAEDATAQPVAVDVADVVRDRVDMWQPLAQEGGIDLSLVTEPASAFITQGHLEQVLDNLIANAMDALSTGDQVNVSVHSSPTESLLTVADNGPGMSVALRAAAFDRFESGDSGRKSGLGLAIVARLLAMDHGSIALDETPGGGLTATIRLPARTRQ
jgi:signal transduction histidine kinase